MEAPYIDLIYQEPSQFYLILVLLIGIFAAVCLEGIIESLYYLVVGKRVGVTRSRWGEFRGFVIFLVLFILFEYVIYYIAESFLVAQMPVEYSPLPYPLEPFQSKIITPFYYEPIDIMYMTTIFGTAVYAILQVPYSIYMYIKRDKVRGKRALNRLILLIIIGVVLVILFDKVITY